MHDTLAHSLSALTVQLGALRTLLKHDPAAAGEELDEITLRRELEALGTHESDLDRREAELDREREGLKDTRVQILAHELDADSREAGLRDQEARLAARERQLAER